MTPAIVPVQEADGGLGLRVLRRLESLVRIDSQSDETSPSIPSTAGQTRLADLVARTLAERGVEVTRDRYGNVLAELPGRGAGAARPPLAFSAHLDTSRGTRPVERLERLPRWNGERIPYPANRTIVVDVGNYPAARPFVGQEIVFGPGDAPFGLDDKLGLAQMLTLVDVLVAQPEIAHPPLLLIARADEEIGRMEAVVELAAALDARDVRLGFTLDGLAPFEINVENFNAAHAAILFPSAALDGVPREGWRRLHVDLGGVNTHGATAKEEGHRDATRFAAELLERLAQEGLLTERIVPAGFRSDESRDCDGRLDLLLAPGDDLPAAVERAVEAVVAPHRPRGASHALRAGGTFAGGSLDRSAWDALRFTATLLRSDPGFPIAAEDSEGREGYSAPYRSRPAPGGQQLDVRLRDFDPEGLRARERHLARLVETWDGPPPQLTIDQQYVDMGPRLADRTELVAWPEAAARAVGVEPLRRPIRGGTGVDPFLDRGIALANLGTGYFAPESEKEFTSIETMARHVRWLAALVQIAARGG